MAAGMQLAIKTSSDVVAANKAAAAMEHLAGRVDKAGDEMRETTLEAKALDAQISKMQGSVRGLANEFARTGDKDIAKQFREARTELAHLQRMRKAITPDDVPDPNPVRKGVSMGLRGALTQPEVIGAFVGAAALAAPAIGALVASAVIGVVGGAGLIGGAVAAAKSPAVQEAWKGLGSKVGDSLKTSAAPFQDELIHTAEIFATAWDSTVGPAIGRIFTGLAPVMSNLAEGLAGFVANMMPGLERMMAAAKPFFAGLAQELPGLGKAMDSFFDSIADAGPGATKFFMGLLRFVGATIRAFGNMVEWLSKAYDWMTKLAAPFKAILGPLGVMLEMSQDAGEKLPESLGNVDQALRNTGDEAQSAAEKARELSDAFNDLFNVTMDADEAADQYTKDLLALQEAALQYGTSLDATTKQGLANRDMIRGLISDAKEIYDATIAAAGGEKASAEAIDAARAAYRAKIDEIRANLLALGYNAAAVDNLLGKYYNLAALPNITKTFTMIHTTEYRSYRAGERGDTPRRWGGITEHARMGLLNASVFTTASPARYAFAEPATGGEAFVPRKGNYGRSMSILSQAANWYGADVVPRGSTVMPAWGGGGGTAQPVKAVLEYSGAATSGLDRLFSTWLRDLIRTGQLNLTVVNGRVKAT